MKDCEKIIVVLYIPNSYSLEEISTAYKYLTGSFDETVKAFLIPISDGDTHMEVLNPRYVPEDKYKEIVEYFDNELANLKQSLNL